MFKMHLSCLFLIAVASLFSIATCLQCFSCNDTECEDPFDEADAKSKNLFMNCPSHFDVCTKRKWEGTGLFDNWQLTYRNCRDEESFRKQCKALKEDATTGSKIICETCDEHFCNSDYTIFGSSGLIFGCLATFVVKYVLFN